MKLILLVIVCFLISYCNTHDQEISKLNQRVQQLEHATGDKK